MEFLGIPLVPLDVCVCVYFVGVVVYYEMRCEHFVGFIKGRKLRPRNGNVSVSICLAHVCVRMLLVLEYSDASKPSYCAAADSKFVYF